MFRSIIPGANELSKNEGKITENITMYGVKIKWTVNCVSYCIMNMKIL